MDEVSREGAKEDKKGTEGEITKYLAGKERKGEEKEEKQEDEECEEVDEERLKVEKGMEEEGNS